MTCNSIPLTTHTCIPACHRVRSLIRIWLLWKQLPTLLNRHIIIFKPGAMGLDCTTLLRRSSSTSRTIARRRKLSRVFSGKEGSSWSFGRSYERLVLERICFSKWSITTFCSSIRDFTRSPMVTTPIKRLFSITGRWRTCLADMMASPWSTV